MIKYILMMAFLIVPLAACNQEEEVVVINPKNIITIRTVDGTEHEFNVELAVTPKDQATGLMHRTELEENAGMLFWFGGEEAERSFWMKNTLLSLDLLFIKADGSIWDIHENAEPHSLIARKSYGDVAAVLEINGGLTKKLEIYPDDVVIHEFFKPK